MVFTADPPPDDKLVPLQQHAVYLRALHALGREARFLSWGADSALVVGDRMPATLRGPVWTAPPTPNILRALPLRLIEAEDAAGLRAAGYRQVFTPATVGLWDIRTPVLHANMHGKWRNTLRRAQEKPLRITHQPMVAHEAHPLLTHAAAMAHARRYKVVSPALLHAIAQTSPKAARIFTAHRKHDALAHMLFIRHGVGVTYQLGWTSKEGRKLGAHRVILHDAARYYADRGCCQMDLGTLDTDHAPDLARFKLGTGAQAQRLGGSWLRISPRLPRVEVGRGTR